MNNLNWTIIGTKNARKFLHLGTDQLDRGGSAIDAVERVINAVEENPYDLGVGFNGIPNLLGEVELDASIMIGSTKKAGAVAGIKVNKYAISVARKVMELSPHVLLVGEGADKFALSTGFIKEPLLDNRIKIFFLNVLNGKAGLDGIFTPEELQKIDLRFEDYLKIVMQNVDIKSWYDKLSGNFHGTVNVIALDQNGEICSGVSTSGLALKFPGRAGDSPIIGAGNYCDTKFGSATCVGKGEIAIRLNLASRTVFRMESLGVTDAVIKGIEDIKELNENGIVQILAMDKEGNFSACSTGENYFVYASKDNPSTQKQDTLII